MKKYLPFIVLAASLMFSSCWNTRINEHDDWKKYFDEYGVDGCFEIYDNNKETAHFYNKDLCAKRFTPASTFKIFNSLVALETGIAPDEQLVIKWDGKSRYFKDGNAVFDADTVGASLMPDWSKDLTMAEAFKVSAVPYYQEIARRVGATEMQAYLDSVKYGNMNIKGAVDQFWLNDTLKISADEQVGFVKRLYFGELPAFSERTQRIVRGMMLQKESKNYNLYYKTGWGKTGGKNILWVVGYAERFNELKNVETGNIDRIPHPYFFALNFIAKENSKDLRSVRIELLQKLLAENGL